MVKDQEDVLVRQVTNEDFVEILKLYGELNTSDVPLEDSVHLRRVWDEIITSSLLWCLVAELGGSLVSTCLLVIVPNLSRGGRPFALIENVVTSSVMRKKGFGTMILHAALEQAWSEGCYKVMLLTGSKKTETLSFYEKVGFKRNVKEGFVAYPSK